MSHINEIHEIFLNSAQTAARSWKKGEYLCREGCELKQLHYLVSGKFRVFRSLSSGKEMLYRIYLPESIIGDIEVFTGGEKASCSVQCVEQAQTLAMPLSTIREHPESAPELLFMLGCGIARKLHENSISEALTAAYPLEVRLAHYFLNFTDPELRAGSLVQLADWMGCSYRHLTRSLGRLELQGAIIKANSGWEAADQAVLKEIAGPMLDEELGRTLFEGVSERSS